MDVTVYMFHEFCFDVLQKLRKQTKKSCVNEKKSRVNKKKKLRKQKYGKNVGNDTNGPPYYFFSWSF